MGCVSIYAFLIPASTPSLSLHFSLSFFTLDWVTNGRKDVNIDSLIYQPEGLTEAEDTARCDICSVWLPFT